MKLPAIFATEWARTRYIHNIRIWLVLGVDLKIFCQFSDPLVYNRVTRNGLSNVQMPRMSISGTAIGRRLHVQPDSLCTPANSLDWLQLWVPVFLQIQTKNANKDRHRRLMPKMSIRGAALGRHPKKDTKPILTIGLWKELNLWPVGFYTAAFTFRTQFLKLANCFF